MWARYCRAFPAGQALPMGDSLHCKVVVQRLELLAITQQLPRRVPKVPMNLEKYLMSIPAMGIDVVHVPLSVLWGAKIISVNGCPVREQHVIVCMVWP